jgi:iron complex outermembrane receptor protein
MLVSKTRFLAGAALFIHAVSAHAQDVGGVQRASPAAAAEADSGLGDIVVTARRVQENLQDVPVSVAVYTGEQLIQKGAVNIGDVGTFTPGFNIQPNGSNPTAVFLQIRGQVQNEILATVEPSVGTYIDEMYWARAYGLNASLLDVANVQVLKGPQGTLFGRNTTGGALLVTSNDPNTREIEGSARFTYGRFNERTADFVLNLPASDTIAFRGAFHMSKRDGWAYGVRQYNATTGLLDNGFLPAGQSIIKRDGNRFRGIDELQGRLKALWEISGSTKLILSGEWFNAESAPSRQLFYKVNLADSSAAGDNVATNTGVLAYQNYFRDHPRATGGDAFDCDYAVTRVNCDDNLRTFDRVNDKTRTQTYVAKLVSDTPLGQLKLIGGYRQVRARTMVDIDGVPTVIHSTTLDQDLDQWSAEAQLTGSTLDDKLDYATGVTYFTEGGFDRSYSFSTRPGGVRRTNATRNYGAIDNKSYGIYGQASYHVTDALTVTGGLRYSHDKKGIEIRSANVALNGDLVGLAPVGAPVPPALYNPCNASGSTAAPLPGTTLRFDYITGATATNDCTAFRDASFEALSWTAGIDYDVTDDILVYGKISRGYRAGGHNMRAFNDYQFVPFDSETLTEVELGFKSEFFDRRARLNVAAYRNILNNAQRNLSQNFGLVSNTLIGNAAKARNIGIEADLTVRPLEGLSLTASGSYNDFKYLKYADATGDLSNTRPVFVPKYSFTFSGSYRTMVNSGLSLTLNTDYTRTGSQASERCTVSGVAACWQGGPDATGRTAAQISRDIFDITQLPASDLVNARVTLGIKDDAYTLALWGKNLLNDMGRLSANALLVPYRNYVSGTRRTPATYGVTATVNF